MIKLYFHSGSANHGCEAIVRSTKKILGKDMVLYSSNKHEDEKYGMQNIVEIKEDKYLPVKRNSLKFLRAAVWHKLHKNDYKSIVYGHKHFFDDIKKGDIYLSIGGDNYCYNGVDILEYYNKYLKKKGAKTVLWGCSIEPDNLTDEVVEDLKRYDLITARETLTYEALKSKGIKNNVVLCSDPAFQLDCEKVELPNGFIEGNTIGINISPLINNYSNSELILNNYKMLIDYIIKNTNFNIVLIPHVVKDGNDDINSLKKLYDEFKASKRMIIISDCNCMQLKECISKCRMFIGARTHATIASYSTCVPTLVVGYSVKARGIARDIFGKDENYVIPVQSLKGEKDLQNAFIWLMNNEDRIRKYLIDFMPEYKNRTYLAKEALDKLYK